MSHPPADKPAQRQHDPDPGDVTMLLRSATEGDKDVLDKLMAAIYDDLRRIASAHLSRERPDHTFQPTALIHEAYLKLLDQRTTDWNDRLHFFAFASQVIRRILIDHARAHNAQKRGGEVLRFRVDADQVSGIEEGIDLLSLDEAMGRLVDIDPRQARVVELRFFGGCSLEEIAELLGVAKRTIDRDWLAAKAWLFTQLGPTA